MLWFRQIFESDFCQLGQGGELYLHEYFQKKISKNSKTSRCKPFLCLPSIGTYSYKGKFLHFGNAAPVPHKFIPEQFPSHEAHKIWCRMGSYLQIWFKTTFTIISQGPQNSHIYPFWGFFNHPVDLILSNFAKILLNCPFLHYIRLALCEGNCPGMILWGTGAASPKCKNFPL